MKVNKKDYVFVFKGTDGYLCKDNHRYWLDDKYNKHTLIYHVEGNLKCALRHIKNWFTSELKPVKVSINIKEIGDKE